MIDMAHLTWRSIPVALGLTGAGVLATTSPQEIVPVALGLLGGLAIGAWAVADRLARMAHDADRRRLDEEIREHDRTRAELSRVKSILSGEGNDRGMSRRGDTKEVAAELKT